MKKQIFYFSATGNNLAVAREVQSRLQDYEIHSLVNNRAVAEEDCEKSIILVTPVYMYDIPHIVKDFINYLRGSGACSAIIAGGGEAGKCFSSIQKLFSRKGFTVTSMFNIPMPSNYTPFGLSPESKRKEQLESMKKRMDSLCTIIREGKSFTDNSGSSFIQTWIYPGIMYSMGYKYINYLDKSFISDEKCNGCGICVKICPVSNIALENNKPQWHQNCQQCFACLQWCPEEAIQYGKKTNGVERYQHPDVTLKEIIQSANKGEK